MALICFASQKGSPGATLTALAVAASFPVPNGRRKILLEADCTGGTLGLRYQLPTEPGLLTLAAAIRSSQENDLLWQHSQELPGGLPIVACPDGPDQVYAALAASGRSLGRWLDALPDVDVICDVGRLTSNSPTIDFVAEASAVLMVARPNVEQLQPAARRMMTLAPVIGHLGWVLIGDSPYGPADVETTYGMPVVGVISDDSRAAGKLESGVISSKLVRSPLVRSAGSLAEVLADWLRPNGVSPQQEPMADPAEAIPPFEEPQPNGLAPQQASMAAPPPQPMAPVGPANPPDSWAEANTFIEHQEVVASSARVDPETGAWQVPESPQANVAPPTANPSRSAVPLTPGPVEEPTSPTPNYSNGQGGMVGGENKSRHEHYDDRQADVGQDTQQFAKPAPQESTRSTAVDGRPDRVTGPPLPPNSLSLAEPNRSDGLTSDRATIDQDPERRSGEPSAVRPRAEFDHDDGCAVSAAPSTGNRGQASAPVEPIAAWVVDTPTPSPPNGDQPTVRQARRPERPEPSPVADPSSPVIPLVAYQVEETDRAELRSVKAWQRTSNLSTELAPGGTFDSPPSIVNLADTSPNVTTKEVTPDQDLDAEPNPDPFPHADPDQGWSLG